MVSYRIQKFGASAPVVGDLVLLEGQDDAEVVDEDAEETDGRYPCMHVATGKASLTSLDSSIAQMQRTLHPL